MTDQQRGHTHQKLPCEGCGEPTVTRVNGEPYCSGSCYHPVPPGVWEMLWNALRDGDTRAAMIWFALTPVWAVVAFMWAVSRIASLLSFLGPTNE